MMLVKNHKAKKFKRVKIGKRKKKKKKKGLSDLFLFFFLNPKIQKFK